VGSLRDFQRCNKMAETLRWQTDEKFPIKVFNYSENVT
jgi:hypothetical protein